MLLDISEDIKITLQILSSTWQIGSQRIQLATSSG
jgi:hypothetical protein